MRAFTDSTVLGNILRKYRKENRMTQAEAAFHANMNETYISAVEHGYSMISFTKYVDFCEGIGADPLEVMKEYLDSVSKKEPELSDDENFLSE